MSPQQTRIMKLTGAIFNGFWRSHVKTIGHLVQGLLISKQAGLAAIGHHLITDTSPKHNIKRVDYYLGKSRVDVLKAARQLAHWLIGQRREVYISVDWTKVRQWPVLVATLAYKGRGVPIFWAAMDPKKMCNSMNRFEFVFCQLLKQHVLPKNLRCILIMDRGFRRVSFLKQLHSLGFYYVIRTGGNTQVQHRKYRGKMQDWVTQKGQLKELKHAYIRQHQGIQARLVGCWDVGQKEPWILCTNLDLPKRAIVKIYGKRFQIEETFRDYKCPRFGLGLSRVTVSNTDRLEKLMLIVVLAHCFAMMLGDFAKRQHLDSTFRANTLTSRPTHSLFTLGLYYWQRMKWNLQDVRASLRNWQNFDMLA